MRNIAFAGVVALAAACAEEVKRPPVEDSPGPPRLGGAGGSTSSGPRDGGTDGGDAGLCTDLPASGGTIPQQIVTGDVPAGTGGAIRDGTYDITEALFYGGASALPGPSGASYQGSIRIAGQGFERHIVFKSSGGAIAETSSRGTLNVTGASGVISLTCPFAAGEQVTYSATDNNLVLSNLVTKESFGLTRKP